MNWHRIPIHIELKQNCKAGRKLNAEETDGLSRRKVSSGKGSIFGPFCEYARSQALGSMTKYRVSVPTALSSLRSHRSFIVHPAPRIINAPMPKRLMNVRGTLGGALSA